MAWAFWGGYVERLAVVASVLAAVYLLARRLRGTKFFTGRARCVNVIESTMLSQHAALHVVRVGKRCFLIGSAAGGVSTLAELNAQERVTR
jgi:flagellar biogenesis protein FliO